MSLSRLQSVVRALLSVHRLAISVSQHTVVGGADFLVRRCFDISPADFPASVLLSAGGEGHVPGHATDFDYYHGVGVGGQVGLDGGGGRGGGGAAVIVARVPGVPLPARTPFFFTGEKRVFSPVARNVYPHLAAKISRPLSSLLENAFPPI